MKFEQAQISRKLTQATASHRKLAVKRGTTMHKQKFAMTCVLVWSGLKRINQNQAEWHEKQAEWFIVNLCVVLQSHYTVNLCVALQSHVI